MSTVTGVAPNALNVVTPNQDQVNSRELRAPDESRVFTPVEESSETDRNRNRGNEQPAREAERAVSNQSQRRESPPDETPAQQRLQDSREPRNDVEPVAEVDERSAEQIEEELLARDQQSREQQTEPEPVSRPEPGQSAADTAVADTSVDTRTAAPERPVESRSAPEQRPADTSDDAQQQERADREQQERQEVIQTLSQRDREVRAHEQAHKAVAGEHAGAVQLSYTQGPDGKSYATSGEVPIRISRSEGDPEATRNNAEQVRRAALAPAEPSPQDLAVAAEASQLILDAQQEIRALERAQESERSEERAELSEVNDQQSDQAEVSSQVDSQKQEQASETRDENLDQIDQVSRAANEQILELDNYEQKQKAVGGVLDFVI